MMTPYTATTIPRARFLFFTGKGGVGKTSLACASAAALADRGEKVLLVSTDPASNLQDVFRTPPGGRIAPVPGISRLEVLDIDPIEAAEALKEQTLAPLRGQLPASVLEGLAELLSGSCTVEIAALVAFAKLLAAGSAAARFDRVVFDTAPTGHSIRMLQLPAAWTRFMGRGSDSVSCLGPLSALGDVKAALQEATARLADPELSALVLVARPERTPLLEAARAAGELSRLGMTRRILVVNGVLENPCDPLSRRFASEQRRALEEIPAELEGVPQYFTALRPQGIAGAERVRELLAPERPERKASVLSDPIPETEADGAQPPHQAPTTSQTSRVSQAPLTPLPAQPLSGLIEELHAARKRIIFTMGKGGVGKTTAAELIARGLAERGEKVLFATTDPAARALPVFPEGLDISAVRIDEREALAAYRAEVLERARKTLSEAELPYVEEDLRSPCTQEIAVFRRFAAIVARADAQTVVIDTAPTGHALLLLDASLGYEREVERAKAGEAPEAVRALLPRLRSNECAVVLVTLAETTPFAEAKRLEKDLARAGLEPRWWLVNATLAGERTSCPVLAARTAAEARLLSEIVRHARRRCAALPWSPDGAAAAFAEKEPENA